METEFWERDIELISHADLKAMQLANLKKTLKLAAKSPYYSKILTEPVIESVKTLDDIRRLPLVDKQTLRENFPYGFVAKPMKDIVRLHSSSGTTGTPTVVFHTQHDLDLWANMTARSAFMAGARNTDVFQNIMGYGLFTGGLGFHYGMERLGALVIPSAAGNSKRQIWFMKTFGTTVCHILPSYSMRLLSFFPECGLDPKKDLKLRIFFIGAEPHSDALRRQIDDAFGVQAFNSYGLSEMCGPGLAFECRERNNGMHLWEDQYLMEIIDPVTGEVLPDGEEGELVLTSLQREAMPLIRYRTHDLTRIIPEPCPCGRTHRRIARFKGRTDDMLIINGVNIFPQQIEKAIMTVSEIGANYMVEVTKDDLLDRIHVKVEINPACFSGSLEGADGIRRKVADAVKSELGVNPRVELLAPNTLPEQEGKAKRVFDLREKDYAK